MTQLSDHHKQVHNFPSLLLILYAVTVTISITLTNKIIDVEGFYLNGCLVVFPLLYFFGDITAEIFGYRMARKLLWQVLFAGLIFALVVNLTMNLPSADFYNNTHSYKVVFGMDIKFVLVGMLAIWIGGITNALLIAKTKIICSGRYFWARSILATSVGELVNSIIAFPLGFMGLLNMSQIINMVIVSYIFKVLYAFFAAYPANLIVNYFKKSRHYDIYEPGVHFNPFV